MRGIDWLLAGIVLVVVMVPFGGISEHELAVDGIRIVGKNDLVLENRWGDIFRQGWWKGAGATGEGLVENLYRPLTVSWFALWYDGPDDVGALGRANVFLHGLVAALRYVLVVLLFASRPWRRWLGAGAALLCGVHAISVEGVVGQVGAAEMLAQFFVLASWIGFTLFLRRGPTPLGLGLVFAAAAAWLLALLSKESAAMFPVVLFVQALFFPGGGLERDPAPIARRFVFALASMIPFCAPLAGWIVLRIEILGAFAPFDGSSVYAGFAAGERIASALATLGTQYLPAFFWPFGLSPNIDHEIARPAAGLSDPRALLGLAVALSGLAGIVVALRRRCPAALFGLAAVVLFLPTSNLLVGIGAVGGYRFLYGPLFGVVVALGALVAMVGEWRRAAGLALAGLLAVIAILGFVGARRLVEAWSTPTRIAAHAYEIAPRSLFALQNRSVTLYLDHLGEDVSRVPEADAFLARFDDIEDGLARIPSSGELPLGTRVLASRLLSNHAKVLVARSQLEATDLARSESCFLRALDEIARAAAYAKPRPEDRFTFLLDSVETQLERFAILTAQRRLTRDLLENSLPSLRLSLGAAKRALAASGGAMPDALRLRYEYESARCASVETDFEPAFRFLTARRLERAYAIDPYDPDTRLFEANRVMRANNPRLALVRLEEVIDQGRASVSILAMAGAIAGRLGDGRKEVSYLSQALTLPALSPTQAEEQRAAYGRLQEIRGARGGGR
ncbi:MAG: hypothetical protein R3F20_10680 [Planctomycetota bacterium]